MQLDSKSPASSFIGDLKKFLLAMPATGYERRKATKKTIHKVKHQGGKVSKPLKCSAVVGDVVSGQIRASSHVGVIVAVGGTVGRLRLCDISTRFISGEEVSKLYPVGGTISDLLVTGVTADNKLELKLKSKLGEPAVGSVHKVVVKRVEKYGVLFGFSNSMMRCLCETEQVCDGDASECKLELAKIQPGHKFNVKVVRVKDGKVWVTMKKSELGSEATTAQPIVDEVVSSLVDNEEDEPMLIDEEEEGGRSAVGALPNVIDALETETDPASKKKSKRQKDAAKRAEESALRAKEETLLAGDWKRDPQSAEEFERLLVEEGNAGSVAWLKYMSFWLKLTEVNKARRVADRAIAQPLLADKEKFNVWVAYLNLEAAFGDDVSVETQFVRATQYCDAKKIYHAMPQVWVRCGNSEKAKKSFERMIAKFPLCRKAWINLVEYLFTTDAAAARDAFKRCIKSIPAHKKTRATVKFAQMEFRNGNPERGATVFDSLIEEAATKTDVWSVYFDETIRAHAPANMSAVRDLFERAISLRLKAFKTKFFFKRWLDFETKFGNDESVQLVKDKAVEYVESVTK